MLYREIITVCSEIHIKRISTLCGQNVEFLNVVPDGTYSDHFKKVIIEMCTVDHCGSYFVMHCYSFMLSVQGMLKKVVVF